MSVTCIVCLGDLEADRKPVSADAGSDPPTTSDPGGAQGQDGPGSNDDDLIAHLLPCGHDLHNDCLKPWVERANSCPICRQDFNLVMLSATVGGAEISSYPVENKVQVADVDPSMLYDDEEEDDIGFQHCEICDGTDNQELLLLCEGCDLGYHVGCVNLDRVPAEDFWCDACIPDRPLGIEISQRDVSRAPQGRQRRAYQARGRRTRSQHPTNFFGWQTVWQSVWDNLDLDLDNPSEDDEGLFQYRQSQRLRALPRRSRQAAWRARQEIAEEQGGTEARFEDTRPALLNRFARRRKSETPPPLEREVQRAWEAHDKAKEAETARPGKRKRQSKTTSPAEPDADQPPERKLKRPNTRNMRRAQEPGGSSSDSATRSTNAMKPSTDEPTKPGPSFLQTLLKKVEDEGSPPSHSIASGSKSGSNSTAGVLRDHASPGSSSSPGSSPASSNYPTPRALSITPPPLSPPANRPTSPLTLTSRVEPIFPQQTFSPSTSPSENTRPTQPASRSESTKSRPTRARPLEPDSGSAETNRSRPRTRPSSHHRPMSSPETSPERARKADIQTLVKAGLRPYHQDGLSKENYTLINRDVSRMLYSKIGDADISSVEARESWEKLAADHVAEAVAGLAPS